MRGVTNRSPMRMIAGSVLAAALFVIGFSSVAGAHHPEIVAEADCEAFVIRYTATAWDTSEADRRHNNNVVISLDGVDVGSGQFTAANGFTFSGEIPATAGTHTIRATSVVRWGPDEDIGVAGEWRETTVTVPEDCVAPPTISPTTTTTSPSTSVTVAPIDTTPPTTAAPPTSVPTVVEGVTVTSPPAQPVPSQPSFTG